MTVDDQRAACPIPGHAVDAGKRPGKDRREVGVDVERDQRGSKFALCSWVQNSGDHSGPQM